LASVIEDQQAEWLVSVPVELRSHNICVIRGSVIMHVCFNYASGCYVGVQTKGVKWHGAHLMLRSIRANRGEKAKPHGRLYI
jgi:hypothetical protein